MTYQTFPPTNNARTRIMPILGLVVAGCIACVCIGAIVTLFLFNCSGLPLCIGPNATKRLPPDAEAQIREQFQAEFGMFGGPELGDYIRNQSFEVVGTGEPTLEARQQGVTKFLCVHHRMEIQVKKGIWKSGTQSVFAYAIGNRWYAGTPQGRDAWLKFGCSLNTYIVDLPVVEETPTPRPSPTRTPRPTFTPRP